MKCIDLVNLMFVPNFTQRSHRGYSSRNHSSSHRSQSHRRGFKSYMYVRQGKFYLWVVRWFFSGISRFCPALTRPRLTRLKMNEIILMGRKTKTEKQGRYERESILHQVYASSWSRRDLLFNEKTNIHILVNLLATFTNCVRPFLKNNFFAVSQLRFENGSVGRQCIFFYSQTVWKGRF